MLNPICKETYRSGFLLCKFVLVISGVIGESVVQREYAISHCGVIFHYIAFLHNDYAKYVFYL